jgi:hypothetical protein
MMRFSATLLALAASACLARAVIPDTDAPWIAPATNAPPAAKPAPASPAPGAKPAKAGAAPSAAQLQAALDQLTQSNHELLELLKKQQAVLEDMQFDRRLQSRQIASLEERLEEALTEKHEAEDKVAKLESEAALRPIPAPTPVTAVPPGGNGSPAPVPETANASPPPAPVVNTPPPPPESYLPPEGADSPPGTMGWHRLFTLKGDDNKQTDLFVIHGKTWRVLWHNQDKPGKMYANTSALFINAFPKDDTIPQKVSSKLGSGGDATELMGPGKYYLKVEASGGTWELAVEELR